MSFNILEHLSSLTIVKETPCEYHCKCPVCGDGGFKIDKRTGKYDTFKCGCKDAPGGKQRVIDAISPPAWKKPTRSAGKKIFTYYHLINGRAEGLVQVVRQDDGQGNRTFYQQYQTRDRWVRKLTDAIKAKIHLYQIFNLVNRAAQGKQIFLVEGEGVVDALLALGIPATTAIGGAKKWRLYGYPNYLKDLEGYRVVLCPDRDTAGMEHCEEIETDLKAHGLGIDGWCYAFPKTSLWQRLPKSGGADLADWIDDGATRDEILAAVEAKRSQMLPAAPADRSQLLTLNQVRQQLERLITESVTQADTDIQIADLVRASGHQHSVIYRIYQSLVSDADLHTATQGAADDLEQLRTIQRLKLSIEHGLHGDGGRLASQIQQVAEAMPTAPEFLVTTLIPVLATAMGTAQILIIHDTAGYTAQPIFRIIIVAPTGTKKTPAQSVILKPLTILEESAANDYAAQIANYDQEHREWLKTSRGDKDPGPEPKKPIRQRYITQDSTLAARIQIHSENPRGLLLYKDEASAFITERGRFTSGKGDGGEFEADLSEFNGGAVMIDRKGDGSVFMAKTAINRVGATQYSTLQRLMGGHNDDCGEFARYLFCAAEAPPSKIDLDKDVGDIGLTSTVMSLFDALYKLPEQSYRLSPEAKTGFQNYQHELTERQIAEDHPSLQSAYPKFETYFGRFILWLHLVNAALADQTPESVVDGYTVELARQWTEYFIGQFKLVLAINSPQQELTGDLLRVHKYLKRKGKPLNVRAIQGGRLFDRSTDKTKRRVPYLKELLSTLVEQGWLDQQDGLYSLSTPNLSPSVEQNVERSAQHLGFVEQNVEQMLSSSQSTQRYEEQVLSGFAEQNAEQLISLLSREILSNGNEHHLTAKVEPPSDRSGSG
ncbi:MAG: DUF3987 domain-containing protein [Nodosilinea sp.]